MVLWTGLCSLVRLAGSFTHTVLCESPMFIGLGGLGDPRWLGT